MQHQSLNLISSDDLDPINISINAAIIFTDSVMSIHNNLPEKTIKSNTSVSLPVQHLKKQKTKLKRAFIKTRNSFIMSALSAISKIIIIIIIKIKNKYKAIGPQTSKREFRIFSLLTTQKVGEFLKKKSVTRVKKVLIRA